MERVSSATTYSPQRPARQEPPPEKAERPSPDQVRQAQREQQRSEPPARPTSVQQSRNGLPPRLGQRIDIRA